MTARTRPSPTGRGLPFAPRLGVLRSSEDPAFLYLSAAAGRAGAARPRCRRLGEFRVAVWASSPLCRIDSNVPDLFGRAIDVIARAGAMVDGAAAATKVRFAPDSLLEEAVTSELVSEVQN
jgi:hypothetical protein